MRLLANRSTTLRNRGPVVVDEALRVAGRRAFFTPDEVQVAEPLLDIRLVFGG